jgi:hypothetical protein
VRCHTSDSAESHDFLFPLSELQIEQVRQQVFSTIQPKSFNKRVLTGKGAASFAHTASAAARCDVLVDWLFLQRWPACCA